MFLFWRFFRQIAKVTAGRSDG